MLNMLGDKTAQMLFMDRQIVNA